MSDVRSAAGLSYHKMVSGLDKHEKLYQLILMRRSDANVPFRALLNLLRRLGFVERVRGDHHIFAKDGIEEILNLQPKGGKAKPYQVNQVRNVIVRYRLTLGE